MPNLTLPQARRILGLPAKATAEDVANKVAAYQLAAGLPVTGALDAATVKALHR